MARIDVEKIIKHLKTKWPDGKRCPMCNSPDWRVQDSTFELRDFHPHAVLSSGQAFPVVPVVCNNCGNTILLNAFVTGIVAPGEVR
jgi:hypothetical protein